MYEISAITSVFWRTLGPVLLATAAKLRIGQEKGTRDKPSQYLNKVSRYWLDTGVPEEGEGR